MLYTNRIGNDWASWRIDPGRGPWWVITHAACVADRKRRSRTGLAQRRLRRTIVWEDTGDAWQRRWLSSYDHHYHQGCLAGIKLVICNRTPTAFLHTISWLSKQKQSTCYQEDSYHIFRTKVYRRRLSRWSLSYLRTRCTMDSCQDDSIHISVSKCMIDCSVLNDYISVWILCLYSLQWSSSYRGFCSQS